MECAGGGTDAHVDAVRILASMAPEMVPYLTRDDTEKHGRVKMAVEAMAAVLSAGGVSEDAKKPIC